MLYAGRAALLTVLCAFTLLSGCRSPYIQATIDNQSGTKLGVVEVDYPSASFGVESLAAGAQYHYRFKIQGSGPVKVQFTDAQGKVHEATGPDLEQGQEGQLTIRIVSGYSVDWNRSLMTAR